LLHREVSYTAYQYPFALNLNDCAGEEPKKWAKALLDAIGELSNVAGGHARSYFEMAPVSLVARLTPCLVCGFNTYGFDTDGGFADLGRIKENDLPGSEFVVAGALARKMEAKEKERLTKAGVDFLDNPQAALRKLATVGLG
jgi:CRISPR-associated protein Cst2